MFYSSVKRIYFISIMSISSKYYWSSTWFICTSCTLECWFRLSTWNRTWSWLLSQCSRRFYLFLSSSSSNFSLSGPQTIGTRVRSDNYLVPGMVLSDGLFYFDCKFEELIWMKIEPGFYLDNKFGIRIENCVVVVEKPSKVCFILSKINQSENALI